MSTPRMKLGPLKLELRTVALEREIAALNLPSDIPALVGQFLAGRQQEFEGRYNKVACFLQLKSKGSFWIDAGFKSLEEMLARWDLPQDKTLRNWETLVRTFSKETFLLLGDEVLGYMTLQVATFQNDPALHLRDYKAIFDAYAKEFDAFDKVSFYKHVHWYVNTTYAPPKRKAETDVDKTRKPTFELKPGESRQRVPIETPAVGSRFPAPDAAPAGASAPPPMSYDVRVVRCPSCVDLESRLEKAERNLAATALRSSQRREWIEDLEHLVSQYEAMVKDKFGAKAVLKRPSSPR